MDISKLRSDRVSDAKVSDKKTVAGTGKAKNADGVDSTQTDGVGASTKSSSPERVNWSENAMLAADGVEHARNAPDVRSEKIAALKAAIASGNYKVDPGKIADKMLQTSLEDDLLTRKGNA